MRKARKLWLTIHLALALGFGAIFVVIALTGSALVFYLEIDRWFNPELRVAEAGERQSVESIYQRLLAHTPGLDAAWRMEMPKAADEPVNARHYGSAGAHHDSSPRMVAVDPYTLAVTSDRVWGTFAMTWIYDLHFGLLLGGTGHFIVGILGLVMTVSLLTGLYLWWPLRGKWRGALTAKRHASVPRRTYDLHKLTGVYSAIVLAVLGLSGFVMNVPEWATPVISMFSPVTPAVTVASTPVEGGRRISADRAVAAAVAVFPDAQARWVETPRGPKGVYMIRMYRPGEPSYRFPRTYVWLDQYDGSVLARRDGGNRTAGDAIMGWLHPLHNGEAFGLAGRLVVLVSGFALTMLFVTGILRWRQKARARSRMQRPQIPPRARRVLLQRALSSSRNTPNACGVDGAASAPTAINRS